MVAAGKSSANALRYRKRWLVGSGNFASHVAVPDDVVVLDRDPSPCFLCGQRTGCRHRPWEALA